MKIKPWNIYLTRGGKSSNFPPRDEPPRPVLITRWVEREKMRSTWEGWAWWSANHRRSDLSGPFWFEVHGNLQPDGWARSLDITEHLISVRDLLFRKLNPPIALAVSVEAKRAEEALFA